MGRILTVRYKFTQNTEDLYWCPETKKMYIRQPANVDSIVFWLTSTKWTGGYEADCPIREGITMRVVDKEENILFEETLEKDDWNGGTSAKKVGDFADEAIKKIAAELNDGLSDYYEWKEWVLADKEKFGNKDYDENWLFWLSETVKTKILGKRSYLGKKVYLAEMQCRHTVSGKEWSEFVVLAEDKDTEYASAGFRLNKRKQG